MSTFPTFALALLLAQGPGPDLPKKHITAKPKPEAVLAKVNGVPIRASDVGAYAWDWRAYEALQDVITHQMIVAEAKAKKITATDKEIEAELGKQLEAIKKELKPGQTLNQALLEQGFPKSRLYMRIRTELMLDKLVLASFDPKKYVKVSTIIVKPRTEQIAEVQDAIRRAEEAYSSLKNGEPWGDVLSRFADDPATLQNAGLLGWREIAAFPPTVRQEMAGLKPGAITKPAQTPNGYQIFRIEALGSSAQGTVLQELKDAYRVGSRQSYLEELRKRTKVELSFGR